MLECNDVITLVIDVEYKIINVFIVLHALRSDPVVVSAGHPCPHPHVLVVQYY